MRRVASAVVAALLGAVGLAVPMSRKSAHARDHGAEVRPAVPSSRAGERGARERARRQRQDPRMWGGSC